MLNNKVLILVNHDIVIYNFRKELVERLIEEGYEIYLSSPYGERIDELINMGCNYIPVNINRHGSNIYEEIKLIKHYKKIVKTINPSIVLTFTIKPNVYGGLVCRYLSVPIITNITGLGSAVVNGGIKQLISKTLYKFSLKKVSRVFFQNTSNQHFFENNKIALNKHTLLPGSGVNLKEFSFLEYPNDNRIEFVFISRIMKEKGIEEYLKAASYIKEKYPKTIFHVLGFCEESYEERLLSLHSQGVIKYHGMQRDIRTYLANSHCTILPSYHEGMSNVLLESASSGRPIITSNISGCKEIVDDGINGYLVEKADSVDLIEKIEKFINITYQEKLKMSIASRKKVEQNFNREIVVNKYLQQIEKAKKQ